MSSAAPTDDRDDWNDGNEPGDPRGPEIPRSETALRIALTILFGLVRGIVESVLGVIVVFELAWTFITRQPVDARIRALANRVLALDYRMGRYLTYNESEVPFPFADFPDDLEPPSWNPEARAGEALGLASDWQAGEYHTTWDDRREDEDR